ncbi:MAG: class I SAM-dependent methyltransferase [Nitrospirota bacterium]
MDKWAKKQKEFYDHDFATIAPPVVEENIRDFHFQKIIRILEQNEISLGADAIALELGCGRGQFMKKMQKHFSRCKVRGYDISEKNIANCKNEGLDAQVADAETMSISGKFDLIYGTSILHHLNDLPNFFNKISKNLKKGGILLFGAEPVFYEFLYIILHKIRGCWEIEKGMMNISETCMKEYLSQEFEEIKIYRHGNAFAYSSKKLGNLWNALGLSKVPSINDIYIFAKKK